MTNEKHLGNKVLFYWGKDFLFFFEYIKCISDHEYQTKKKGNKEMAKHNSVFLIGSVNWISYSKSDSTEKNHYVMCNIKVIRKNQNTENVESDRFMIICRDPKMAIQLKELSENDVVKFEGTLETMDIKKTVECQRCDRPVETTYPLVYINPTKLTKLVHCNTSEAAINILLSMR